LRILVTRPQPSAADTAMALRARGHAPIVAPLLQIEIFAEIDPDTGAWDAILLTSANALCGIGKFASRRELRDLPIFTVGDATAKTARDNGFTNVNSADGNVDDLADLVGSRLKPPARLLYVAGEERARDLAGALRARNFEVDLAVVYRLVGAKLLPEPAAAALGSEIDGVLHFSRQSAAAFINAARNSRLLKAAMTKPVHFCMSEQVAAPLRAAGAANIRVAARPDEQGLLELCG
jgi:uroporphyrinogen-III synthase